MQYPLARPARATTLTVSTFRVLSGHDRGSGGPLAAILGALRAWRQRVCDRQALAAMGIRDLGDLAVPPSLIRDELRRRWWQQASPQWGEVRATAGTQGPRSYPTAAADRLGGLLYSQETMPFRFRGPPC